MSNILKRSVRPPLDYSKYLMLGQVDWQFLALPFIPFSGELFANIRKLFGERNAKVREYIYIDNSVFIRCQVV